MQGNILTEKFIGPLESGKKGRRAAVPFCRFAARTHKMKKYTDGIFAGLVVSFSGISYNIKVFEGGLSIWKRLGRTKWGPCLFFA